MLCLKEKKGGDRVDELVFLLPFLNYYTTQISSLKKLCNTEATVLIEVVLTRAETPGYFYQRCRHEEGPKNDVGRSGFPKPPFICSSLDKRW